MATYLVTGAAGFIGAKVTEFLLIEGHTVVGVDNLNDAYDPRLKHWRLAQLEGKPGFEFHRLDITDQPALRQLWKTRRKTFDAVINLAARAGVRHSVENPWVYYETNVIGTLNLLVLCHDYSVPKFVLASSSSLYGKDSPMPYREEQDTDHPLSPYAASKKAAEALCYTYHYLYDIDVTICRYFTVYGPAGRPEMSLFRFVQWISEEQPVLVFGDGSQSRDFTYVDESRAGQLRPCARSAMRSSISDLIPPSPWLMPFVPSKRRLASRRILFISLAIPPTCRQPGPISKKRSACSTGNPR